MHIFYSSFDWAASRLQQYLASSTRLQGWDLLNFAVPVAYNSSKSLMFSCVCPPEWHFEFHSSVVRSKRRHGTFVALFRRSMHILQPVLQLADADPSNPESVTAMDRSLGSSVFDAAAHLVALASTSLHDVIEEELCSMPVKYELDVIDSSMNAYVSSEGEFVGRNEEIGKIERCMRPVFQGSQQHCVLALVHGIPGTGKSRLAKRQLELLQRQKSRYKVIRHVIQGRGRGAVRDGLHKMGLALAVQLKVGTAASVDEVLPRLKDFLQTQRFVILADDADTDVLDELLKYVPKSSEPCALVFTSQCGQDIVKELLKRLRENILSFSFSMNSDTNIQLDKFDPDTALELVGKMCLAQKYDDFKSLDHDHDIYTPAPPPDSAADGESHRAFCFFWSIRSWLREVLKQKNLDYLPLAVHALSMWLRQEVQRSESNAASMMARWDIAVRDDFVGEVSSGHRAINATVCLALHNIGSRFSELDDACRQVLGLLALCQPVEVPWSLFDGISPTSPIGQDCIVQRGQGAVPAVIASDEVVFERSIRSVRVRLHNQKKTTVVDQSSVSFGSHVIAMADDHKHYRLQLSTPNLHMRGARVRVSGENIVDVSPVGFHCQIKDRRDTGIILGADGSNLMIKANDKSESMHMSLVSLEPGDLEMVNGQCTLRLRSFHSIEGSECKLSQGVPGVVRGGRFGSDHVIHVKPCSLMFFPIWSSFLFRNIRESVRSRDIWTSFFITLICAALSWFCIHVGQSASILVSANVFISDFLSDTGSVFGFDSTIWKFCSASLLCFVVFLFVEVIFVLSRTVRNLGAIANETYPAFLHDITFLSGESAVKHNGRWCFKRPLAIEQYNRNGRVLQRHADDTVSVVFGCETGACRALATPALSFCNICAGELSALKPEAEVKRFKAGNVRVRGADGVAAAVQEVEGLKRVAAVLRSSGLVQVDEEQRTFGMHQLLQQAVGRELGWGQLCGRMRRLLQARCGQFGDEDRFDVGLYGVMREVAATALNAIGKVKVEGGDTADAWCSGMLLRLYDVAREVYGAAAEFPNRVLAAAHSSLVGDLLRELVMTEGCTSAGRIMTLRQLAYKVPHLTHVIEHYPNFDLEACLKSEWKRSRVQLPAGLLHMQALSALPLMRDVAGLGEEGDLGLLLQGGGGLRAGEDLVRVEGEGEAAAAAGRSDDGGMSAAGRGLRAMRWRWHTLRRGNLLPCERMVDEIGGAYCREGGAGGKWEVAVALGAACDLAFFSYSDQDKWSEAIATHERALCMRLDTLGEQHPATASTLAGMGSVYGRMGNFDEAVMLKERSLRITTDTLGLHPAAAGTISSMGILYFEMREYKKSIELYEQAQFIYERTVGRMHPDTAGVILNMIWSYILLGDMKKAKKLGVEALGIYEETLGRDHEDTIVARDCLADIRKMKGSARLSSVYSGVNKNGKTFNIRFDDDGDDLLISAW
jgi:tetratricopeptide (TPR) repeat protein